MKEKLESIKNSAIENISKAISEQELLKVKSEKQFS